MLQSAREGQTRPDKEIVQQRDSLSKLRTASAPQLQVPCIIGKDKRPVVLQLAQRAGQQATCANDHWHATANVTLPLLLAQE